MAATSSVRLALVALCWSVVSVVVQGRPIVRNIRSTHGTYVFYNVGEMLLSVPRWLLSVTLRLTKLTHVILCYLPNSLEFDRLIEKHTTETGLPVVVDFYSDSCGPCRYELKNHGLLLDYHV